MRRETTISRTGSPWAVFFLAVTCGLPSFVRGKIAFQGVEALVPELAVLLDPCLGLLQPRRLQAAAVLAAALSAREQAGALQDAHVLGDGRGRDPEGPRQLRDGRLARGQAPQD